CWKWNRLKSVPLMISECPQVEATIHIDDLTRRIRKISPCNRRHRACYVFGLSPSTDGPGSLLDQFVIFFLHPGGHISSDDARPYLVDIDAKLCQAGCKKRRHHRQPGFSDAVIAAVDRSRVGRNRRDGNDPWKTE